MNSVMKIVCQNCGYSLQINGMQPPSKNTTTAVTFQCPDCQGWDFKPVKSLVVPQLPAEGEREGDDGNG